MPAPELARPSEEKLWNKSYITVLAANCFIFLSAHSLLGILPIYAQQLGATQDFIGILAGSFFAAAVLLRPFIGKAVDKWNRRNILIVGLIIIAAIIFSYSFATSLTLLLILRLFHGLGWTAATTSASTIATDSIPKGQLAEGLGLFGLSNSFSMALAPSFGLFVLNKWGFNSLFYAASALAALALLLLLVLNQRKAGPAADYSKPVEKPVFFEMRAVKPAAMNFFFSFAYSSIPAFIALSSTRFNIQNIGFYFTVQALTAVVSRIVSGRLIDTKGFKAVMLPGLFSAAACMLILGFANSVPLFVLAAFAAGLGIGLVQPALLTMAVHEAVPERRGAANSTYMLGIDLAFLTGAAFWGFIARLAGYNIMYLLGAIPIVFTYVIYWFTSKP